MIQIFTMGVVRKYASRALFLIAPKVLDYGWKKFVRWNAARKLKKINSAKGDSYAKADPSTAHDAFRDLP